MSSLITTPNPPLPPDPTTDRCATFWPDARCGAAAATNGSAAEMARGGSSQWVGSWVGGKWVGGGG